MSKGFWTAAAIVAVVGIGVPVACSYMNAATTVATAPARVVSRTMDTDNIITKYEWFFDTKSAFDSRLSQVQEYAPLVKAETDPAEKIRLRTELGGMKQSCRELANRYNAEASKINVRIFRDKGELPQSLDAAACE